MHGVDRTPHLPSLPQLVLFFTIICPQLAILTLPHVSHAIVPPYRTFTYKNQGEYLAEYGANYRASPISHFPFVLCFYNTTPNAFALDLPGGHPRSNSLWVWEADHGRPVRDNAPLSLSSVANLVLIDADGSVAWQIGTANKGMEGLSVLPNGKLVLYGTIGNFIWQSFDYPTDTLLVGQILELNNRTGPSKLVSLESKVPKMVWHLGGLPTRGVPESCAPPVLPTCSNSNGGANYGSSVDYYKVMDVDHFLNWDKEGDGPLKLDQCREKCDKGCLGFFYNSVSYRCLLAAELGTLSKLNASIIGYIKMPQ